MQTEARLASLPKSNGHIGWELCQHTDREWYVQGGEVFTATAHNPVMTDGVRAGRYECPEGHLKLYPHITRGIVGYQDKKEGK